MNIKLRHISAIAFALSCGAANALSVTTVQSSPGLFTAKTGVCTVDFDSESHLRSCSGATYSANASNQIVSGSSPNQYLEPTGDTTAFLNVGGSGFDAVSISLTTGANYFGFYAGSIDSYNTIQFSDGANSTTLSGDQINTILAGNSANGTGAGYFNVFTDTTFTSITLGSSSAAFETDNHSFGIASPVPEPESIALLGIGLVGLAAAKRRRAK